MADSKHQLAWNLFVEVRKEILEYQKTRTQVIGFKITFVTAGVGLIVANSDKVSTKLFLLPAFAAIFFDLLVASQNVAIKRAGLYCLKHVEPAIRDLYDWPSEYWLWEEYMNRQRARHNLARIGNIGITVLATVPAIYTLLFPFPPVSWISWFITSLLICLLYYDLRAYQSSRYLGTSDKKEEEEHRQQLRSNNASDVEDKIRERDASVLD
jgi:hypothetical protein